MASEPSQSDLNLSDTASSHDGYSLWREERAEAMKKIARKLGLPLGRRVQVWLTGEIRLEGLLLLKDSSWFPETIDPAAIELTVDNVPFKRAEVTGCIRLD